MTRVLCSILIVAALTACDSTAPEEERRDEEDLTFVRLEAGAQAEVTQASFWAVRGQTRSLVVRYRDRPTDPPLLEFVVGAQSLLTRGDGTPVLVGDSVQITVTVDTQRRFLFDFQPAGLTFSPVTPARLRLNYDAADPDFNGDGVVNQLDAAVELRLQIWQQQLPGLPWLPVPTLRVEGTQILEGRVTHFTGFAMAS